MKKNLSKLISVIFSISLVGNTPYGSNDFVDTSFFSSTTEIINQLTSLFKGLFSTFGFIKAISD